VLREQPKFGRKVAGQAEPSMPSSGSRAADSSFGPPEMRHWRWPRRPRGAARQPVCRGTALWDWPPGRGPSQL